MFIVYFKIFVYFKTWFLKLLVLRGKKIKVKIPFQCFGLTYTNDNYVIGYHWPVRRERTRQCLHFLLSALRSFHFAA